MIFLALNVSLWLITESSIMTDKWQRHYHRKKLSSVFITLQNSSGKFKLSRNEVVNGNPKLIVFGYQMFLIMSNCKPYIHTAVVVYWSWTLDKIYYISLQALFMHIFKHHKLRINAIVFCFVTAAKSYSQAQKLLRWLAM